MRATGGPSTSPCWEGYRYCLFLVLLRAAGGPSTSTCWKGVCHNSYLTFLRAAGGRPATRLCWEAWRSRQYFSDYILCTRHVLDVAGKHCHVARVSSLVCSPRISYSEEDIRQRLVVYVDGEEISF